MRDEKGGVPVGPLLSGPVVVAWRADESHRGAADWPGPLGEACKHCTANGMVKITEIRSLRF
jgi:hypothetical protein